VAIAQRIATYMLKREILRASQGSSNDIILIVINEMDALELGP
jgi:hypothetical protein